MRPWVRRIISWSFYLVLAVGVFCLAFFIPNDRSALGWSNALFISGIVTLGVGALTLVHYFGAFDFAAFGFRSIFLHMRPNYAENPNDPYKDYVKYHQDKTEKRKKAGLYPWPYLAIGLPLIIAAIIVGQILFHGN